MAQKLIKSGIYPDIDIDDYHGDKYKEFIGRGDLTRLLKSPAHYKAQYIPIKNPEMIFGSAAHELLLESNDSRIKCGPTISKNTKAWHEFAEEHEGEKVYLLTSNEISTLDGMKKVFDEHKYAKALTNNAEFELTFLWDNVDFQGIKCKCRPDILRREEKIIVDYKTAASAIPNKFSKSAADYGYDIQSYWYIKGVEHHLEKGYSFYFIVQEKTEPFGIMVYSAGKDLLRLGEVKTNKALTNLWKAKESGKWEAYPEEVLTLDPPQWQLNEYNL